jgi:hypothetical protein
LPKLTHRFSIFKSIEYLSFGAVVGAVGAGILGPFVEQWHPVLKYLLGNIAFGVIVTLSIQAMLGFSNSIKIDKAALCFGLGGVIAFLLDESGGGLPGLVGPIAIGVIGGAGLAWAAGYNWRQRLLLVLGSIVAQPIMHFLMPQVELHIRGPALKVENIDYYGSYIMKNLVPFLAYIVYGLIVGIMYFLGQEKEKESHVHRNFGI